MVETIIRTITEYKTTDGEVFNLLEDATSHEKYLKAPKAYVVFIRDPQVGYEMILSVHSSYPSQEVLSHEYYQQTQEFVLEE